MTLIEDRKYPSVWLDNDIQSALDRICKKTGLKRAELDPLLLSVIVTNPGEFSLGELLSFVGAKEAAIRILENVKYSFDTESGIDCIPFLVTAAIEIIKRMED